MGRVPAVRPLRGEAVTRSPAPLPPVFLSSRDDMRCVIYGLADEREPGRIRYVGQTASPYQRFIQHLQMANRQAGFVDRFPAARMTVSLWMHHVRKADAHILIYILTDGISEDALSEAEGAAIAAYKARGMADLNVRPSQRSWRSRNRTRL